jgi:hypothetical protein
MLPVKFETTISASELQQNYFLERAANGTGTPWTLDTFIFLYSQVDFGVEGGQVVFRFSPIDRKKI